MTTIMMWFLVWLTAVSAGKVHSNNKAGLVEPFRVQSPHEQCTSAKDDLDAPLPIMLANTCNASTDILGTQPLN